MPSAQPSLSNYDFARIRPEISQPEIRREAEHRRDCCDNCGKDTDCSRLVVRCFHEANEDCSKCGKCDDFANRFIKPSKPVDEITAGDR
ncbi:MAG TPA: hypothetical protein VGK23_07310 [Methanomassiliicoccales archaeon]|jgi:hypothetical protein